MNVPRAGLLLALLACCLASPAAAEVEIRQLFSLSPAQQAELRLRLRADPAARVLWLALQREAVAALGAPVDPLEVIHYEGLLDTDPRRARTEAALLDMDRLATLAYAFAASGEDRYANRAREYVLAWARAYRSTGNPINENKLEPVWLAYEMLRERFSPQERHEVEAWMLGVARAVLSVGERAWQPGVPKNNWDAKRARIVAGIGRVLGDPVLLEHGLRGFRLSVVDGLHADGTSVDLHHRDALGYHIGHLEPLLVLAILMDRATPEGGAGKLYGFRAPGGASLRKSVEYVVPFARGERTRQEWRNTRVELDRRRAAAGLARYQPGRLFQPEQAADLLTLASYFDSRHRPLAIRLWGGEGSYGSWMGLVLDVMRSVRA